MRAAPTGVRHTRAVEFTGFVSSRLSPVEREALSNAVEQVNDFLLSELVELYNETAGPAAMRMFSSLFLPDRHVAFYDFALIRRMHVCFVVVAGRLQDRWEPARCRGEELVLRAVIDHAETCLDEQTDEPGDGLGRLREWLFEDLDHEYLFDMAFDGIDDPDTYEGSQLGVASLHPSAWFEPFHADAPVHPLLA